MYLTEEIYVGAKWGTNTDDEKIKFTIKEGVVTKERTFEIPLNKIGTIHLDVGYWRKANQIHAWFITNCSTDGVDDCNTLYVSKKQLLTLKGICEQVLTNHDLAAELLPTQAGFFFGCTEYDEYYYNDIEDTLEILNKLDLSEENHNDFYYRASW